MSNLRKIGEFGLIERMVKKIAVDKSVIQGIGDDTAVLPYTKESYLLFTTDMLIEGVHFSRQEATFTQIGRKALAVNISDIAAMGGVPKYAVVSLGLPRGLCLRAVDDIMRGINTLAQEYGLNIVGGDTVRSSKITLCITLLGQVKKTNLTLRSRAGLGDLIFVTGSLGGSRNLKQFNFFPRVAEAQQIIKKFKPSAMIDLSDGLASDLERIAQSSKVGAVIFEQLIPVSRGATLNQALFQGEDFELLFTVPLSSVRRLHKKSAKFTISCIGKVVERKKGLQLIDNKARIERLKQKGFRHF
ncbi:MAG: thiamine-monophosphate kinase [Candidatus Omnitrophica bacterium]|nr:thiamine-monophosphate kinase [Candidatus Omnitrophota bacterium]